MSFQQQIKGLTTNVAEVTAEHELNVKTTETTSGAAIFCQSDPGTITGTNYLKSPEASEDYAMRVSQATLLFSESFNPSAQHTANWKYIFDTMTMTQSSGFLNCNAVSTATASKGCALSTWRTFSLIGASTLYIEAVANIPNQPLAEQVIDWGLFSPASATAAPLDGVYWRLTNAGLFGFLNYAGTETQVDCKKTAAQICDGKNHRFVIGITERSVEFWFDDVLLADKAAPDGNGQPFMSDSLPVSIQQRNTASGVGVGTQAIFKCANVTISNSDYNMTKPWGLLQCAQGQIAYQGQPGGTQGSTTHNSITGSITTVLTSFVGQLSFIAQIATGLGGAFGITATAPSVEGPVFAYQVPAGSTAQPPKQLHITGLRIDSVNTGASIATTPTVIQWGIGFGATAVSEATAETASFTGATTTKAYRRVPVGLQSWLVGDLVGKQANVIQLDFSTAPIVVNPSEWIAVLAKFIQGTATGSQVIWTVVTFQGFWE